MPLHAMLPSDPDALVIGAGPAGLAAAHALLKNGAKSIVVVDRGGFKFHGRVKQIVEAATAAGLKISERATEKAEEAK